MHLDIGSLIDKKTTALSIGLPFNGTRRWYEAVHGEIRPYDYEVHVRRRMFAVLAMLFASGVKAIYSPIVGSDLESRGTAYTAMARQAVAHLAGDDTLAWSKEHQVHIALYGEMDGLSTLNARLNAAISPDQAKAYLRLGCYAESLCLSHPEAYYHDAYYPLDIWIGMEQFTVFDVPGLLTGHTALYFLQFPTLFLNRRLWRRIVLDWLLIRGNEEDPEALEPPSASRPILGLGRRREGRWSAR